MARSPKKPPVITLLTDFGYDDAYVGLMKGVILGINPAARLVDLTHGIPPQDITRAALILRSAVEYFPVGTIHVAVVDPGVGSARRPLLLATKRALFVGPDNGVLAPAARVAGTPQAYVLQDERYFLPTVSPTFHGRDIFAPVAAHLSLDTKPPDVGPSADSFVDLELPQPRISSRRITGEVIYVDHFGNLITNIHRDTIGHFPGIPVSVSIGVMTVTGPVESYAAVAEGAPVALIGSWGFLEVAVRNGSAARDLRAGPGTTITVESQAPSA